MPQPIPGVAADEEHLLWARTINMINEQRQYTADEFEEWWKPRNPETNTQKPLLNDGICERVTFRSHHQYPARQPCLPGPKEHHLTMNWSRSTPRRQMPRLDCFWQGAHTAHTQKKTKSNSNIFGPPIIPTSFLYRLYMDVTEQQLGPYQGVHRMQTSYGIQQRSW